jgi:hypothetical protein
VALAFLAAPAVGGPLAADTNSYLGIWHSSTPYQGYIDPDPPNDDPSGLTGYVDWAVYAPGQFPVGFTGLNGWVPAADEYVYTYQAFETGPAPLTQLIVTIENEANNIGEFEGDGGFGDVGGLSAVAADVMAVSIIDGAQWFWFAGIEAGFKSYGLAFTSPNPPMLSDATVIDDGTFGFVVPVPSPGGPVIPEPGTLTLASFGLGVLAYGLVRRRNRNKSRG